MTVIASTPITSKSNTAAIAGGVVGGIALLVLIAGIMFCVRRRNHTSPSEGSLEALVARQSEELQHSKSAQKLKQNTNGILWHEMPGKDTSYIPLRELDAESRPGELETERTHRGHELQG